MQASVITQFMQLNGAIVGKADRSRWFRLPRREVVTVGSMLGSRLIGRGGLRIVSTALSEEALRRQARRHAQAGSS